MSAVMINDPLSCAKARAVRLGCVREAMGLLSWDRAAMMPDGGAAARTDQIATLAAIAHEIATDPRAAGDLAAAEASPPDDAQDARNLTLLRRAHTIATALPASLIQAEARAHAACEMAWRRARPDNDFAAVQSLLAGAIALARDRAVVLGEAFGLDPYDALMEQYQPGITAADAEQVFGRYLAWLADGLPRIEAAQARLPAPLPLRGDFSEAAQEGLCRALSERLGLEAAHARLDRSLHPFCGGTPTDVRITTRYNPDDPARALLAVLHETGHALYERGLPRAWARQPLGEAAGMAAHESQSLIVEMQACRSDAFLLFLGPVLHAAFGGDPAPYAPENLARLWRRVARTHIRVDADEVTYPAHVILRFRLERAMIAGDLVAADLPGAWRDGMRALLGIEPPTDTEGCLQDIHWYEGAFGYFPSYTLGAAAAAQLMAAAKRALPGMDAHLSEGDLSPLLGWLRTHVHGRGSEVGFGALIADATGATFSADALLAHFSARYGA